MDCKPHYKGVRYESLSEAKAAISSERNLEATASEYYKLHRNNNKDLKEGSEEDMEAFSKFIAEETRNDPRFQPLSETDYNKDQEKNDDDFSDKEVDDLFDFDMVFGEEQEQDHSKADEDLSPFMDKRKEKMSKDALGDYLVFDPVTKEFFNSYKQAKAVDSIFLRVLFNIEKGMKTDDAFRATLEQFKQRRKAYNLASDQEKFDTYTAEKKEKLNIKSTDDADEMYMEYDKVIRTWPQFKTFTEQKMIGLFGTIESKKVLNQSKSEVEKESLDNQLDGIADYDSLHEKTSFDSMANVMVDHKNTASGRLKSFLAKQVSNERSYLNLPVLVPFDSVYDELQMILAGKERSFESMMTELSIASISRPYLNKLIEDLGNSKNQLKRDFVVAFSKQHQAHLFSDFITQMDNGFNFTQYRNMDSNRNDVVKTVHKKWIENQKTSEMVKEDNGELVINSKTAKKFKAKVEELFDSRDPELTEVQELLEMTGIEMSIPALENLKEKSFKLTQTSFRNQFRKGGVFYYMSEAFNEGGDENNSEIKLDTNNPLTGGESRSINILARVEAEVTETVHSNSWRSVEGKTVYSYGLNSHFSHTMRDLVSGDGNNSLTEALSKITFSKSSDWLNKIKNDPEFRDNLGFYYLDGFKKQKSKKKGKTRGNQSKREMEMQSLSLYQNGGRNKSYFMYSPVSDKTTSPVVSASRHESSIRVDKDGNMAIGRTDEVNTIKTLMDIVWSEVNRIDNYKFPPKGEEVAAYDPKWNDKTKKWEGGAIRIYNFPFLNELVEVLYDEETNSFETKYDQLTVQKAVLKHVKDQALAKVKRWQKLGIVSDNTSLLDQTYLNKVASKLVEVPFDENDQVDTAKHKKLMALASALDMEINYVIANANTRQLITGDPAAFSKGDIKTTLDVYTKRLAKDIAPGMDGYFEDDAYTIVYMDDLDMTSKHAKEYGKVLGRDLYDRMNSTDAQEYTTLKEHIDVMYAFGKLSESVWRGMSNKISDSKENNKDLVLDESELKLVLQPMKPVQVYNKPELARDLMMPVYIKSSSFPLVPQLTRNLEIDKLRVVMEGESGNDINRSTFKSAAKVGATKLANIWEASKDGKIKSDLDLSENIVQLSRAGFRIQQEVPFKEDKVKISTVTQMNKLLFEGILHVEGMSELRAEKEEIRKKMFDRGFEKFQKSTGIEFDNSEAAQKSGNFVKVNDMKKFQKALEQEAIDRGYPLNDIQSLQLSKDGKDFVIPISMQTSASKFQAILMSMISNNLIKHKISGKSYVQGSSAGFLSGAETGKSWSEVTKDEKDSIVFAEGFDPREGLKYIRKEDGVVKPAQMLLPFYLRDKNGKSLKMSDYTKKVGNTTVIDTDMVPQEVLHLIGARIPNQGHSSMIPIEVVGFLPEAMGDLIIVPSEITTQMGADFDVDKLYTYQYKYDIDEKTGVITKAGKEVLSVKKEDFEQQESTEPLSRKDFDAASPHTAKNVDGSSKTTKNGFTYTLRKGQGDFNTLYVSSDTYKTSGPIIKIDLTKNKDGSFTPESLSEGMMKALTNDNLPKEVINGVLEGLNALGIKEVRFDGKDNIEGRKFLELINKFNKHRKSDLYDKTSDQEKAYSDPSSREIFEEVRNAFSKINKDTGLAKAKIEGNEIVFTFKKPTQSIVEVAEDSFTISEEIANAKELSENQVRDLEGRIRDLKSQMAMKDLTKAEASEIVALLDILDKVKITPDPQKVAQKREPVKMGSITFNEQQTEAYHAMVEFMESDSKAFSIEGYAGTGKTTIIKHVLDTVAKDKKTAVSAPTWQAVSVLEKSTEKTGMTLHSLLGIAADENLEDFDGRNPKFAPVKEPKLGEYSLVVIDEASMINSSLYDYLMSELEPWQKVIFMGDPAQLPPVGEKLSKVFSDTEEGAKLTKVERQDGDNPLGSVYDAIRNNLESSIDMFPHVTNLNDKGEGIEVINKENGEEFVNKIVDAFKKDPEGTKVITYTNQNVAAFNQKIRSLLKPDAKEMFEEGDLMMMRETVAGKIDPKTGKPAFHNSEQLIIEEVSEKQVRTVGVGGKLVDLEYNATSFKGKGNITLDILYPSDTNLSKYEKAISDAAAAAKARVKAGNRRGAWDEFWSIKRSFINPGGRSKGIDYGYAITTHKSQGSTYNTVFINETNMDRNQKNSERNSLKYVALSRPRKKAVVWTAKDETTPVGEKVPEIEGLSNEEQPIDAALVEPKLANDTQEDIEARQTYARIAEREDEASDLEDTDASLQNDYIDIHWNVLTHPEVMERIINPLDKSGYFSISDDADKVHNIREKDKTTESQLFSSIGIDTFIQNKSGKAGVGVFSLASTFNAYIQGYDLRLGTVSYENGQRVETPAPVEGFISNDGDGLSLVNLSDPGNNENGDKSSNISDMQSAAVDNANEQKLDKINLNSVTFPAAIALNQLSDDTGRNLDITYTTRFFPQQIIKDFAEEISNLSDFTVDEFYTRESAKIEVRRKLRKEYTEKIENKELIKIAEQIPTKFSPDMLLDFIKSEGDPSDAWYVNQMQVLDLFLELDSIGTELTNIQSAMNTDSKGVQPSFFGVQDKIEKIEKIPKSPRVRGAEALVSGSGEIARYSAANYYATEIWSKFLREGSALTQSTISYTREKLNKPDMTVENKQMLFNNLKSFMMLSKGTITPDPESERRRLLIDSETNKSISTRLKEAQATWGKDNFLLERLLAVFPTSVSDPVSAEYNAAIAERLDETEAIKGFLDMLGSDNAEQREFGEDLVTYLYLGGANQSARNFLKFVPTAYLKSSNIANRINQMKWNKDTEITSKFFRQFIQHNPHLAQSLVEYSKFFNAKQKTITLPTIDDNLPKELSHLSYSKTDDKVKKFLYTDAITIKDGFKSRLFLKQGSEDSTIFKEVDKLGNTGDVIEYIPTAEQDLVSIFSENNITPVEKTPITTKEEAKAQVNVPATNPNTGTVANSAAVINLGSAYGLKDKDSKESVVKAIKKISKDSTDPYNRALAKVLEDSNLIEDFDFEMVKGGKNWRGRYDYATGDQKGKLSINASMFKDDNGSFDAIGFERTLIHELIHQHTGATIHEHYSAIEEGKKSPLPADVQKAIKSLDVIRTKMTSELSAEDKIEFEKFSSLSIQDKKKYKHKNKAYLFYALSSPREFVTQVLTSENFQKQLSNTKFNDKQSVLDRILSLFQDLFVGLSNSLGIKVDGTLLREAVASSINLIEVIKVEPNQVSDSEVTSDNSNLPSARQTVQVTDGTQVEIRDFVHSNDKYSGMKNAQGKVRFFPSNDTGWKNAFAKATKANKNKAFDTKYGEKYMIKVTGTPLGYMLDVHQYKDTTKRGLESDYDFFFDDVNVLDPAIEQVVDQQKERIKTLERKMANSKSDKVSYQARIDAIKDQIEKLIEENSIDQVQLVAEAQLDWAERILSKPKINHSELTEAAGVIDGWNIIKDVFKDEYSGRFARIVNNIAGRAKDLDNVRQKALLDWVYKNTETRDAKKIAKEDLEVMKDTGMATSLFLDISRIDNPAVQSLAEWLHNAARDTNYEFTEMENETARQFAALKNTQEYKDNGFKVFLQLDENGEWTGGLTNRYSQEYYNERGRRIKLREAKGHKGWKDYFAWKKDNEVLVDSRVLFNNETGDRLTDSVAKKHIKELQEEFGKERAEEMISQAEEKFDKYLEDLAMFENGVRADSGSDVTEEQIQAQVGAWKLENSPIAYINSYNGQAIVKGAKIRGYKYAVSKPRKHKKGTTELTGWYDESFEKIEGDPELKKFYDFYRSTMSTMMNNLPTYEMDKLQNNFIPFVQKDLIETFTTQGAKASVAGLYENFVDSLSQPDNVIVSADRNVKTGAINKRVPIRFIQKGDPENQSTDLVKALELFSLMSLNYKHKTKVEDKALLLQRLVNEAEAQQTTASGENKMDSLGRSFKLKGEGSLGNTTVAVSHAINSALYGERRVKGTSVGLSLSKQGLKSSMKATKLNRDIKRLRKQYALGNLTEEEYEEQATPLEKELESLGAKNVTSVDVADFFIKMTQLKGMGYNIFSAASNMTFGVASNFIHAAGQEDFTTKNMMTAWTMMLAATSKSVGLDRVGVGSGNAKKINNLIRKFDVLFEVNDAAYKGDTKAREKSRFSKMSPFELQRRAEYFIQGMVMVSKMLNTTVTNANGDEATLWDAFNEDGDWDAESMGENSDWGGSVDDSTQLKSFRKFRNATIQLNKRLHGNYDPNSFPRAKKYILGRIVLQFRSWLAEGISVRFETQKFDKQLDRDVKGMYRSIANVTSEQGLMTTAMSFIKIAMRRKDGLENLSDVDKANFKKVLSEMTWVLSMYLVGMMLANLDMDDDDEGKQLNMAVINLLYRTQSDLTFYDNPNSFDNILSNPIPLTRTIMDFGKAIGATQKYFFQDDDIDGRSEMTGERLALKWAKALPYFNQIPKWKTQTEKVLFK